MKVAIITELFHPHVGGQEFRYLRLSNLLVKYNCKVYIFTIDYMGKLASLESLNMTRIVRYAKIPRYMSSNSIPLNFLRNFNFRLWSGLTKYIWSTRALANNLSDYFDIILVNESPLAHLFFLDVKSERFVIDWVEYWNKKPFKTLADKAIRRYKYFTVISEYVEEAINRVNNNAITALVRTPLDIDLYAPSSKGKNEDLILYVGRLSPHKNVLQLIKATILLNRIYNLKKKLVIIGDGPLRQYVEKSANKYNYIKYLGPVPENEKIELFRQAYLLAIPSIREGFPNVVAEAIASETPVLTVDSPLNNVAPLVQKYNLGIVAKDTSSLSLAKALLTLFTNKELIDNAVETMKILKKEFSEPQVAKKLIPFLKFAIEA